MLSFFSDQNDNLIEKLCQWDKKPCTNSISIEFYWDENENVHILGKFMKREKPKWCIESFWTARIELYSDAWAAKLAIHFIY